MPDLRTKKELASIARAFTLGHKLVEFRGALYMPVDFQTNLPKPTDPQKTVWLHIDEGKLRYMANTALHILFATPSEYRSFEYMCLQWADTKFFAHPGVLVRKDDDTLALLNGAGELVEHSGEFILNYLDTTIVNDEALVAECFEVIANWVGSKAQATSLLYHLATALQPTFSARKYVLLIGEGYNGKGTLLKMIIALFGMMNISSITRLDMSGKSVIIRELNGKLLNVVMDGPKEFLKDSSTEKTLIAGEHIQMELKYENAPAIVQTNALFIEALNTEPITSDKSPAVQKRLTRFFFSNVYADDQLFTRHMTSPAMIGAFLQLLLKHWVTQDDVKDKLQLTEESLTLQMEAVWELSPVIRYLEWMHTRDDNYLELVQSTKMEVSTFVDGYRVWLVENGYRNMEDDYLMRQLKNSFVMERKTLRINNRPTSRRCITGIFPDTLGAIITLQNGESVREDNPVLVDMED